MVLASVVCLTGGLAGAFQEGALGSVRWFAVATWFGAGGVVVAVARGYAGIRFGADRRPTCGTESDAYDGAKTTPRSARGAIEPVSASPGGIRSACRPPVSVRALWSWYARLFPMPPDGFASHGLPTTPTPWATQVTWTVAVGTDRTYYERMCTARKRSLRPSSRIPGNTAMDGDSCLLESKCVSGEASQPGTSEPDIDLTAMSADPAVSRLHARS